MVFSPRIGVEDQRRAKSACPRVRNYGAFSLVARALLVLGCSTCRLFVPSALHFRADRIGAEGNQGGDLVRSNLATVRANLPIRIVHASGSKQARAEPIAALYEQRRVTATSSLNSRTSSAPGSHYPATRRPTGSTRWSGA